MELIREKNIKKLYHIIHHTKLLQPKEKRELLIRDDFKIPNGYNSVFFPNTIKTFITNNTKTQFQSSFILSTMRINVYITTFKQSSMSFFQRYMKKIIHWLFICDYIDNTKLCGNTLDIFIYLTPFKKQFPRQRNQVLEPIHVNSGFSTVCREKNELVVFREEEWFKVFIHETFHSYGMDINHSNDTIARKYILQLFNLSDEYTHILLSETYTEVWARIINVALYSYRKTNKFQEFRIHFIYTIKMESYFSIYQAKNILDFLEIQYSNLIQGKYPTSMYREKVAVFSYFILSSIFLQQPYNFMELCSRFNKRWFLFQNDNSHTILKLIQSMNYRENSILKLYNTPFIKNHSLRMTFIDNSI